MRVLTSERRQVEEQQRAEKEAQEQAYITKLQQYQATIAALDQCNTVLAQDPPVLPAKVGGGGLMDWCRQPQSFVFVMY